MRCANCWPRRDFSEMKVEARVGTWHAALIGLPLIASVLALSGCGQKMQFHFAPDARRASEIVAVLSRHGIAVDRKPEKEGVMLSVAAADVAQATRALRESGLLRAARPTADEALGKRGIAPTPLEERARRIHAIGRELEATLLEIDGVVSARVSVVPPERAAPGAPLARASASVLIKHRADVDLSSLVPGIARLVKNGVPGLADQDDRQVAVMLVPEPPMEALTEGAASMRRGGDACAGPPATGRAGTVVALMVLVAGSVAFGHFFDRLRHLFRKRVSKRDVGDDG